MFWKRLLCYFLIWNHIFTTCALADWPYGQGGGRHTADLLLEDLMEQSQNARLSKSGEVSLSPRIKLPKGLTEEDILPLKKQADLYLEVLEHEPLPSFFRPEKREPEPETLFSKAQAALQEAIKKISQKIEALYRNGPDLRIRLDQVPLSEEDDTPGLRLRAFQGDPSEEEETRETLLGQTILDPVSFKGLLLPGMKPLDNMLRWEVGGLELEIDAQGNIAVCGGKASTSLSLETAGDVLFKDAVSADWLAVKSAQCSVHGSLDVENLNLATREAFFLKGRHAHLQARHVTLHEGNMQIGRKAKLSLLKGGTLDLQKHHLINESLLESLDGASIIQGDQVINQGRMVSRQGTLGIESREIVNDGKALMSGEKLTLSGNVVNGGRVDVSLLDLASPKLFNQGQMIGKVLKGWMGEGRNQGDFMGTDSLDITLKGRFDNHQHMGSHRHLNLTLQDQFFNEGDLISNGVLRVQGEGSLENHWTIQGGKWGMSLGMKALENHSLIQSQGNLFLSPGHHLLNHQGGWIHALGNTTLSGKGTIQNDGGKVMDEEPLRPHNPRLEGAGLSFERDLTFQNFTGSLLNPGAWMTGGKAQGNVPLFKNQGLWQAGFSALVVERFENNPGDLLVGGKILGNGQWTVKTGVNRSIIQGEDLEIVVQDTFEHHPEGALQGTTRLAFSGAGHLDLRGTSLSEDTLLLNPKTLETSGKITAPYLTMGEDVTRWVNGERGEIEVGTLSFPGQVTQARNEGQISAQTLSMTGGELKNDASLTVKDWILGAGRLLNQRDGTLTFQEWVSLPLNSFMNEGEVLFKKGFRFEGPHEALRLSGLWESRGLVDIKAASLDVTGEVQALQGSTISSLLMTIGEHGKWWDGGAETLWNIEDTFRNNGTMSLNHWHLKTGKQGYQSKSLVLGGNALIEGDNFYHNGKTRAKGNIIAMMKSEFCQGNTLFADGNITLDALILSAYAHSKTKAAGELALTTSYPLTGYWEGLQHFSWAGKTAQGDMISKGTLISPTKTTFVVPNNFENRGTAELNHLSMDLSYGHQLTNTGEMTLPNPVKLGQDAQLVNKKKMQMGKLDSLSQTASVLTGNPLLNKVDFDKDFIETKLLPLLQKMTSHNAYKNYQSFITTPGTSYRRGENLDDYWQRVWLNDKDWGSTARNYVLPPYSFTGDQPFAGHLFQHMSNEGELLLSGEDYKIRGTLFNKKGATLIHQSGGTILHNVFTNEGAVVAPHGLHILSRNSKKPLLFSGSWQMGGWLNIQSPDIDVTGEIQTFKGSTIAANRLTFHPLSLWWGKGTADHSWAIDTLFKQEGRLQTEGFLRIWDAQSQRKSDRTLTLDIKGQMETLLGSRILSKEMILGQKALWQDGGSTYWNIQSRFDNQGEMIARCFHLRLGEYLTQGQGQGFQRGSVHISGNGLIDGNSHFYNQHKIQGGADFTVTLKDGQEFCQGGALIAEGDIRLNASILSAYDPSLTQAGKALFLNTSYPLVGTWKGLKHLSWEGVSNKKAPHPLMRSKGTLISPVKTTLKIPQDFQNEGKAFLRGLHLYMPPSGTLTNTPTGEMELLNPVSLGYDFNLLNQGIFKAGSFPLTQKPAQLFYRPSLTEEDSLWYRTKDWQKWYNGQSPWHLLRNVTNQKEMSLSGGIWRVAGTFTNAFQSILQMGGGEHLTFHALDNQGILHGVHGLSLESHAKDGHLSLKGRWESPETLIFKTPKVLTNEPTGLLISPHTTHIYASHGVVNKGKAHLSGLSLYISPGSALLNTGDMFLNQPVSLGYDFNLLNQGRFAAGNLTAPLSTLSYMVFDPKEDFYGKGYKEWVEEQAPWHLVRNITNEGELLLSSSGQYWKVSGDILNKPSKILQIGGGLRLRSKGVPKNQGILRFLTHGEVEAHLPLVFTSEWQGNQHLTFWAPSIDNRVGKVRSKGILSLTSTQSDILVGQAQKIMRPVRELSQTGYKERRHMPYPPTFSGLGYMTDGECMVQHLTNNDALFQSGTGIQVSAKGKLLNHFGLMHSQGFMTLKADREIDNYSGTIQAQGDMVFQTPYLQNRLSDTLVERISEDVSWGRGNEDIGFHDRWQHPASDPALIASTGGNITFVLNSGRNHGSRILGAKNVLFKQGNKTSSTLSTFDATSAFMGKNKVIWRGHKGWSQNHTYWINHYPSVIQGGNTLQIAMPGVKWSQEGMMNAPVIAIHLNTFDLNAHLERLGGEYHRAIKPQTNVQQTLIINLEEMFPSSVVKALKEGESVFNVSSSPLITQDQIVQIKRPGDLSSMRGLPFYLSREALQGSLMQALSSLAGTLNITKELSLEGQMRALHRQAKERSGGGQEMILKDEDLKDLKKSFIGYVVKKIGNVQTLVAHLYLSPHDVNTRGLELASLTGDDVTVHADSMNILGSLYGENQVTLTGREIRIERPEIRFKEWVEESSTTRSLFGSKTKSTKRLVEFVLPGEGGKVETGDQGGLNITSDILRTKGAQLRSGQKGTRIYTSKLFHDQPFITTEHLPYEVSEGMMGGGEHTEKGFVRKDTILPSQISSKSSLQFMSEGSTLLQATHLTSEKGNIGIRSKGTLFFPGVKAVVENVPILSTSGSKIEKTVGSQEIGEIAQIKAPKGQVILESLEGEITGVRPHILSQSHQIKAPQISLMEELDFRKTLQRQQQTFTVASAVDPGLMTIMAAAITLATAGAGSASLGSAFATSMGFAKGTAGFAMMSTGANALVSQAMLSTLVNQGNLGEVVKEITSKEALQSLGITMATSGITQKLGLFHPGQNAEFLSHVKYQTQKALVNVAVSSAIKGGDMQDTIQKAGIQVLINSFASYGAERIGKTFDPEKGMEEYLSHKLSHGVWGGLTGFALEGDMKGAISGAMGAIVSEVVAEQIVNREDVGTEVNKTALKEGWSHDQGRIDEEIREKLQPTIDKAKLVSGVLALLSRQNVDVALQASANALENNFINHATGKILEEQRKAQAEKLYHALEAMGETVFPGMSLEQAQRDLEHLKDHIVDGIFGYGDLWQENGQEIARFVRGNERLESVLGTGGKGAGILFGVGMTVPNLIRGKPGGKMGKPNRTLQGLDLPVSKAAQHIWVSRVNAFKKQQARNGHKGLGEINGHDLIQTIGDNRFLQEFYVQDLLQTFEKKKTGQNLKGENGNTLGNLPKTSTSNTIKGLDLAGSKFSTGAENRFLHEMYVQELRDLTHINHKVNPQYSRVGSFNPQIYDQKVIWTAPKGTQQTYKVYQRNDIDWDMVRIGGDRRFIGKTNREAALYGINPQLKDGNSINLHHIGQDSRGPLIEVSTKQHSAKNAQAFKALHNQHNGKKHPDFPVSHDKDWISDIKNYWKWRANNGK